ncbi:hypothetical protein CDAR_170221 [Caerostris darwini]|nr:hypothetical protein CDAR_170221 [Caerostris darwini]
MQADYALRRVWTRYLAKNTKNMNSFLSGIQPQLLQVSAVLSNLKPPQVIVEDRHLLLKIRVLLHRMFPDCGEKEKHKLIKFNVLMSGSIHKCTPLRRLAEESPDKFLWTLFQSSVKHLLYTLAVKSWKRRGPHFDKDEWQGLGECILNYMYSCKWHPKLFQSHNTCTLCLLRMWEPCKVSCHHEYHRECLVRWRSMGHDTCPLCQAKISQ